MISRFYRNILLVSSKIRSQAIHSLPVLNAKYIPLIEAWRGLRLEDQYSFVMSNDVSDEPEMAYQKGWLSIQYGDICTYQACKAFESVISLRPDWVEAYIGRAFSWRLMGDKKNAEADFAKALSLNSHRAEAAFAKYCELILKAAECRCDKTIPDNLCDLPRSYKRHDSLAFKAQAETAHSYNTNVKSTTTPTLR